MAGRRALRRVQRCHASLRRQLGVDGPAFRRTLWRRSGNVLGQTSWGDQRPARRWAESLASGYRSGEAAVDLPVTTRRWRARMPAGRILLMYVARPSAFASAAVAAWRWRCAQGSRRCVRLRRRRRGSRSARRWATPVLPTDETVAWAQAVLVRCAPGRCAREPACRRRGSRVRRRTGRAGRFQPAVPRAASSDARKPQFPRFICLATRHAGFCRPGLDVRDVAADGQALPVHADAADHVGMS